MNKFKTYFFLFFFFLLPLDSIQPLSSSVSKSVTTFLTSVLAISFIVFFIVDANNTVSVFTSWPLFLLAPCQSASHSLLLYRSSFVCWDQIKINGSCQLKYFACLCVSNILPFMTDLIEKPFDIDSFPPFCSYFSIFWLHHWAFYEVFLETWNNFRLPDPLNDNLDNSRCISQHLKVINKIIIIDVIHIIIIIGTPGECFTPALVDGFSLDSEWQQITSGLRESYYLSGRS